MGYNEKLIDLGLVDCRLTLPRNTALSWSKRDPSALLGAVYHQSLEDYGTASGNAKYHSGPNHLSDIGLPGLSYTIFIEKSGKIILANDVESKVYSQGYADLAGDENALYISACFGGNFPGPGYDGPQDPTRDQLKSADKLWKILKEVFGFNDNQLFGHYDFGKPSCPGYSLSGVIESINKGYNWSDGKFNLYTISGKQDALKELKFYDGEIDGEWGPQSRLALTNFQKSVGITPDGVWNKKTANALMKAL